MFLNSVWVNKGKSPNKEVFSVIKIEAENTQKVENCKQPMQVLMNSFSST